MNKFTRLVLPTLLTAISSNPIGVVAQASPVLSGREFPQAIVDYPRIAAEIHCDRFASENTPASPVVGFPSERHDAFWVFSLRLIYQDH